MSEYQGLLQDVVENPADDAPRLILADYLEDYGTRDWEKARSEFIRLQITLFRGYGPDAPFGAAAVPIERRCDGPGPPRSIPRFRP